MIPIGKPFKNTAILLINENNEEGKMVNAEKYISEVQASHMDIIKTWKEQEMPLSKTL